MSFQDRSHMIGLTHHLHTMHAPLADENSFVFAEDSSRITFLFTVPVNRKAFSFSHAYV